MSGYDAPALGSAPILVPSQESGADPERGPDEASPGPAGRLRLVQPAVEHIPMLITLGSDEECLRWGDACPTGTETAARAYVRVADERWRDLHPWSPRQWVIQWSPAQGLPWQDAGVVEYRPDGHGAAEVGYAVHPDLRGRGVAVGALDLALEHAFINDGVRLARWRAEVGNWASRRVSWRLGFSAPQQVRGLMSGWGQDRQPRDGWISTLAHDEPRTPRHAWREAVELVGERVMLRAWREDAADTEALLGTDGLAHRFVGPVLPPRGSADTLAVSAWLASRRHAMANGETITWCIADVSTDAPLGLFMVFDLTDPFARGTGQVGYWLLPEGRGQGAVTESLGLVARYAFDDLGLHRLAAVTDARNDDSQRALRRAGFAQVSRERQSCVYVDGGPRHDTLRFELLGGSSATGNSLDPQSS